MAHTHNSHNRRHSETSLLSHHHKTQTSKSTTSLHPTTSNNTLSSPEQRRQFIQAMYNQHNGHPTPPGSHSTLHVNELNINLQHSATTYAASDSFVLDAQSPLFADDHLLHQQQSSAFKASSPPPTHTRSARIFTPKVNRSDNNLLYHHSKKQDTPCSPTSHSRSAHKPKSFTITPPNSPMVRQTRQSERVLAKPVHPHALTRMDRTKSVIVKKPPKKMRKHPQALTRMDRTKSVIVKKPPKKMRKKATPQELELVLKHYQIAMEKEIELILQQHEPHILVYRDQKYEAAKQKGIDAQSDDAERLKVLGDVVKYTYMNIEPPDEYTKKTDRKHFKEVAAWSAKFAKNKGIVPSLVLIFSAWCHDIERFIPATKCKYLPEAVDKYRKQVIHAVTSAKVATCLLKGAPVSQAELDRIYQMVLHHDMPDPREDIVILGEMLIKGADDDLMWELEILMDADSFAFFQSTIYYFIMFKAQKNSPDWIWERVANNVKRLRPHLRMKAAQCINELPSEVLTKVNVNYQELTYLCSDSAFNTPCPSHLPSVDPMSPSLSLCELDRPRPNKHSNINEQATKQTATVSEPVSSVLAAMTKMSVDDQEETSNESNPISESEHYEMSEMNENKNI
eukprot:CAMPEP_0197077230 /NCGR_PEP_ID=MMETSP1384-20130603/212508_1 /TAXON_ID=29189 /ORGANISM="Ammonia sp." /LENGTH=622 /DNA_ID=CAMNT_0042516091 /DNA_START=176 /DNA_END=2044 /DNA_ORIENTATION=+